MIASNQAAAGHIVAGRPSATETDDRGRPTTGSASMHHLFERPGPDSLCGEVSWVQVMRATNVTAFTWICARCKALAAGQPDPAPRYWERKTA